MKNIEYTCKNCQGNCSEVKTSNNYIEKIQQEYKHVGSDYWHS